MSDLYTYDTILAEVRGAMSTLSENPPAGVYDSQDGNAVLMGALANQIGPVLADAFEWQQFRPTFTVTGDGATTSFPLPAGFSRFIAETGWSETNRRPATIMNTQQWAAAQAWIGETPYLAPACRIQANALEFLSAPANAEVITFPYLTRNWVLDEDGITTKEVLETNLDKPMFDSLLFTFALKLKWAEVRGMPTAAFQQDFTFRFNQITGRNQIGKTLFIGAASAMSDRLINGANIPDTGYGG